MPSSEHDELRALCLRCDQLPYHLREQRGLRDRRLLQRRDMCPAEVQRSDVRFGQPVLFGELRRWRLLQYCMFRTVRGLQCQRVRRDVRCHLGRAHRGPRSLHERRLTLRRHLRWCRTRGVHVPLGDRGLSRCQLCRRHRDGGCIVRWFGPLPCLDHDQLRTARLRRRRVPLDVQLRRRLRRW